MKKVTVKVLVAAFCVLGFGFCYTQNTSASLITNAWINWNSGIDWDGGTTFGVGMSFGNCGWCEQNSDFRCISPGYGYTTSLCDWNEYWDGNDSYWNYYWVELYSCNGWEQDVAGQIKERRRGSLTANAKRTGNNAVLSNNISSGSAWTGDSVTVNRCNYNPAGYTFARWDGGSTSCNYSRSVWGGESVTAWYDRNEFAGRAYVSGNGASADTGYVENSVSRSAQMDCANGGCSATFYLQLKTIKGSGGTPYTVQKQKNGGSWSNVTSGTSYPGGGGKTIYQPSETLYPGQSACYRIVFRPYGGYSNEATSTETACMTAKVTNFYGKSGVSGATSGNTGWQNTNVSRNYYVNNCSPTDGCKVSFDHAMKRTNSNGTSAWTVSRTSNLITSSRAISNATMGSGTFNATEQTVKNDGPYTLYPGMVVCEKLTFKPSNNATITVNDVYTQACASALGNAQPANPGNQDTPENPNSASGDSSFLNIKVRNQNVAAYSNFQREVYAKPDDNLTYRATYNPVLQYTYYLKPQRMRINGGTIYPSSGTNTSSTLAAMFNLYKGSLNNWNNDFTVFSSNFTTAFSRDYNYADGNTTKRIEPNDHKVQGNEVGKSLDESAQTNRNNTTKTTPSQVTFSNNGDTNLGNVITTQITKTAYARVPYNFINTTKVTTDSDTVLYAGEEQTFGFTIDTSPKRNNVTDGTYATVVRGAKWKLELCYNGSCQETTPVNTQNEMGNTTIGDLNAGYNLNGVKNVAKSITINIPDITAGSEVCVRSAVYPANSGADTNWSDAEGSHTWAYSDKVCYTVAKKPNLEVWGGNIYTKGGVNTSVSNKGNLYGYNNYAIEQKYSPRYVFGSWSEWGLISGGKITGLSSGANLGFALNDGGALWPNYKPENGAGNNANINGRAPGGSTQTRFCNRVPETFANYPCGSSVGALGNSIGTNNATGDKNSTVAKYTYGGDVNTGSDVLLNNPANLKVNNIYYYYGGGNDLVVSGATANGTPNVSKETIQMVHSTKNIAVTGNLTYEDGYTTLDQMPKLIIYAEKDINISCGVQRIDAILIANGNVKTCGESDDINAQANSNQLVVNGAIIANSVTANRTYGAATGANSMVPAEIINYDPTLYLWGGEKTEAVGETKVNLDTTYSKEVAPRL